MKGNRGAMLARGLDEAAEMNEAVFPTWHAKSCQCNAM